MYEAVHAHPDGNATVARLAVTAREFGYDGVVVRNHGDRQAEYEPATVANTTGVDVIPAIELRTDDRSQLAGLVDRYRKKRIVVCVHGTSPEINRHACETPEVDVLCHPMRADGDMNQVLARAARENGVRVEFNFAEILRETGGRRTRAVAGLHKLLDLVEQYDVPYVVSADPFSHLEIRAPRELAAVGERAGIDRDVVLDGLREWRRLADRNRDRTAESFIEPGVRRGPYEEDG